MEFEGRPPPAYGLKFLVKAGSPEPVITRQLCALAAVPLSTAAGVAVAREATSATHPTATAGASQRVVRRLRRIGLSFLARVRGRFLGDLMKAENVSGTVTTFFQSKSSPLTQIPRKLGLLASGTFRNVLQ